MTCRRLWLSWCVAKGVVISICYHCIQSLADGSRAPRARFQTPGADTCIASLYVAVPHRSHYGQQGCRFASELACRSHVAHSKEPALSEGLALLRAFRKRLQIDLRCPDAERFDGNTQPSCLASHLVRRISKTRPLIGTSRRPSAVLLSGTKITRFCQSRFSIRIRKSSLSFLIPVSRIKMTMSTEKITEFLGASCKPSFPSSVSFPLHRQDEDVDRALSSF